jgi:hypothetical protein
MSSVSSKQIRKARADAIKHDTRLGVSFSVQICQNYQIDWKACLQALIDLGIQRFRIMSYWDEYEPVQGIYDFSVLDQQLELLSSAGATATLCIGIRQPRWPESHIPSWALILDEDNREAAYLSYHQTVIDRYLGSPTIESWQLENEFWNKGFGLNNTFSRKRLVREFNTLRLSDPETPIIMSLGNTTGLPLFAPKPDLFSTTIYLMQYQDGRYTKSKYKPWYFKLRRVLVRLVGLRSLVIHELQAEPWGPVSTWDMNDAEQAMTMNSYQLKINVQFARNTGIAYMDLWGGEWWYWRKTKSADVALWTAVQNEVLEARHSS